MTNQCLLGIGDGCCASLTVYCITLMKTYSIVMQYRLPILCSLFITLNVLVLLLEEFISLTNQLRNVRNGLIETSSLIVFIL